MVVRIVSICSLFLAFAFAGAQDYQGLSRKLEAAKTPEQAANVMADANGFEKDEAIAGYTLGLISDDAATQKSSLKSLTETVELRALASAAAPSSGASGQAKTIKELPFYKDNGVRSEANWLSRALDKLKGLSVKMPHNDTPSSSPSGSFLGPWVTWVMWTLLGAAVIVFAFLGLRHVDWKRGLRKKTKALLDEDEPERTLDEWLQQADMLAREGKYREAVRALYLACLLKFDEAHVARFDRSETNWEHLARIQASPKRPAEVDFSSPTKAFDQIWYGMRVRGMEDVDQFRNWYGSVRASLEGVR